ncbi:MAG TPA: hypothetical protein VIW73_05585 [Candidatus Cybelea sp.]
MAGISKRLSFIFTIASAIAYASCGGLQQASTPLPGGAVSQRASKPPPRDARSGQPELYVSCFYLCRPSQGIVYIYPLAGPNQPKIGSISKGVDVPSGLSVDSHNSLYVANSGNGTVTVYPNGSKRPSMTYSKGVHVPLFPLADSAGHVFVSGRSVFRFGPQSRGYVFEYNAGANVPIAHARIGLEADGIAEDGQGNLYVAYRYNMHNGGSIAEFGPALSNKRLLGIKLLHAPAGLLVDSAGNIVVAESGYFSIDVFPPGAKTPTVRVSVPTDKPGQLAMQNDATTLWVSAEKSDYGAYVYYMPYPLTSSTIPAQYESFYGDAQGIAVSPH